MNIIQIPAFIDNYLWLLYENNSESAVAIDPGDSKPILRALESNNLILTDILITHHHNDHIGGIPELKKIFPKVNIYGPDDTRIPTNIVVNDEDVIKLSSLNEEFSIIDVKGHTNSHIAYYFDKRLFCGDTLFSCGCGRLFEGTYEDMHRALTKIKNLPKETMVYCAHEYTSANAKFALYVDPDNAALQAYARQIEARRAAGVSTVPSLMGVERRTNPFLRSDDAGFAKVLGMEGASPVEVFAEVRGQKDNF